MTHQKMLIVGEDTSQIDRRGTWGRSLVESKEGAGSSFYFTLPKMQAVRAVANRQ